MANYKYPRFVEFRETLPMTATGKNFETRTALIHLTNRFLFSKF